MDRTSLRALALGFWFAIAAQGQPLSWTLLRPAGSLPAPRIDGTVAWDAVGRQLFLFGGTDAAGNRNDLWVFSWDRQTWTLLQPGGGMPAARFGHSLVFDSVRRRVVLFGGQAAGAFFSDVWAYDVTVNSWRQLGIGSAGPLNRYGHGAIYETARDRLVITHGFTTSGRFDDTWAFDFTTNTWTELTPSGTRPLKRCLLHSAYDATHSQMYLYGGCASGFGPCPLGDLWTFDLNSNSWTERTPQVSPEAREHYGLAFDATRAKLEMFGGFGTGLLGDTWDFDPAKAAWMQAALRGASPDARQRQESASAGAIGTLVFGGAASYGYLNELWLLGPSVAVVDAFSGAAGSVAPGEAVSIYGSALGPAVGTAQSFDAKTLQLPVNAAGVSVTWNGIPSPLYYASAGQLNVQVPYEVSGASEAEILVSVSGAVILSGKALIAATHPGVFPLVFNPDLSVNSASNPAARGSTVFFFASGQGVTSPASVTGMAAVGSYPEPVAPVVVTIGGSAANIVFKGQAPYTAGVMQVNVTVPADAPAGNAVPVTLQIGGTAAQSGLTIAVK